MYIEPLLDFNVWLLVKNVCWLLVRDFYTFSDSNEPTQAAEQAAHAELPVLAMFFKMSARTVSELSRHGWQHCAKFGILRPFSKSARSRHEVGTKSAKPPRARVVYAQVQRLR